jgi:6-phosphogluconolactonase
MHLHKVANAQELASAAADWLIYTINNCLQQQERCSLALSGGNTPKMLHHALTMQENIDRVDWTKVDFFWGDERYVSFTDERNNAKMAYETLLNFLPVTEQQIHIMRTDIEPADAALDYEKTLRTYFEKRTQYIDIVLLGMGDDGHTLSLFPQTPVIDEQTHWVRAFYLSAQSMYRITLTAPFVNKSADVAFLVSGAGKAQALKEVLQGDKNIHQYPSQIIQPESGELHLFVDEAAAALL